MKDQAVGQVNVSSTDGDLGILAGHVPVILQLRPGVLEVFTEGSASSSPTSKKSFFGIMKWTKSIL
jgi:F0F1-type ATP synthase epsilon subunit